MIRMPLPSCCRKRPLPALFVSRIVDFATAFSDQSKSHRGDRERASVVRVKARIWLAALPPFEKDFQPC